jgi:hypothetical protein
MKLHGMIGLAMVGTLLAESVEKRLAVPPHPLDNLRVVVEPQTLATLSVTGSYAPPPLSGWYNGH